MLNAFLRRYHATRELHHDFYGLICKYRQRVGSGAVSLEDLTDLSYIMKRSAEWADSLRKECEKFKHLVDSVTCSMWLHENINNPKPKSIRGKLAIGTPDVKTRVVLPNRKNDPERWRILMKALGASDWLIESGVVDIKWPALQELHAQRCEQGLPTLPGIDSEKTWDEPALDLRKTRSVDIDDVQTLDGREEVIEDNEEEEEEEEDAEGGSEWSPPANT